MSESPDRSPDAAPAPDEHARELFAEFLLQSEAGTTEGFAALCGAHPEHASELERMHHNWRLLEAGIGRLGAPASAAPAAALGEADEQRLARLTERGSAADRYRPGQEIGRGGMGAVREVWDEDLERTLAMKTVALPRGSASGSARSRLARFLREARVTGRLEHPGVVPVHELGVSPDGRPFFTMARVQGADLATAFEWARAGRRGWSLARAVAALLSVCETIAYAHDRGVVHRDLKPANVMVGAFGQIYVMDWGLAKVRGEHEEQTAGRVSGGATQDGEVLGTPAYMPPEQAAGRAVDERADVYSIGAMLYHLLAGAAPFTDLVRRGSSRELVGAVRERAPTPVAELATAAPAELVAVCEHAMARAPGERYASVEALAGDLRAWLEGRVVGAYEGGPLARMRKWVHRNRALTAALAILFMFLPMVTSMVTYVAATRPDVRAARRTARAERVERALEDAFLELGEGDPSRARGPFEEALALDPGSIEARAGLAFVELRQQEPAAALDVLACAEPTPEPLQLLRADALRALGRGDEVREPEETTGPPTDPLTCYVAAVRALERGHAGDTESFARAEELLERAVRLSPSARPLYWFELAHARGHLEDPEAAHDTEEALLALWPDRAGAEHWVGFLRLSTGEPDAAIPHLERALALSPENLAYRFALGTALYRAGRYERAGPVLEAVVAARPDMSQAVENLAVLYSRLGRHDDAVALARELAERFPDSDHPPAVVAERLEAAGRTDEALAALEEATRRRPDAPALLTMYAWRLRGRGRADEARELLERAVALAPEHYRALAQLAAVLLEQGETGRAAELARRALEAAPDSATAHLVLADLDRAAGRGEAALAHMSAALERANEKQVVHYDIGCLLHAEARYEEAIAAFREALRIDPDFARARCNLGNALRSSARFREALVELRRGHELGSRRADWPYPSARWIEECEALAAAEERLEEVLAGEEEATPTWRAELARFALDCGRAADATELFGRALDETPELDATGAAGLRVLCARAAAGAATEAAPKRAAELRARALEWLEEDLARREEALASGALGADDARAGLQAALLADELAAVREEDAIQRLPDGERAAWSAHWHAVRGLVAALRAEDGGR